ncbi:hypothetical protein GCM10027564_06900 [Luteimonas notoginsengisoli]
MAYDPLAKELAAALWKSMASKNAVEVKNFRTEASSGRRMQAVLHMSLSPRCMDS